MNIPQDLRFTESHEWARLEDDGTLTVGITDHAQDALGEVVYVELPGEGEDVHGGAEFGVVESVKAASDVYAPVDGEVVGINERLEDEPELVNDDCYGDGWFIRVQPASEDAFEELMDAEAYEAFLTKE